MQANILIVEDDAALRTALCETAEIAGYRTLAAPHGRAALDIMSAEDVGLVISDIQMEPMDGHGLLREIRKRDRHVPVVMMTAYGSISSAVDAMREGATDYLVKPFEAEVLIGHIDRWLNAGIGTAQFAMVAEDPITKSVVALARRVGASDATVMITGESGVGKEVFFQVIHQSSRRADQTPVAINCAAIPDNMLEAMLFGHEKGAYTGAYKSCAGKFEQAQGSTLLLDEVSEMSLPLQAKLLRVIQEQQVERLGSQSVIDLDVRIVGTSNRDLKTEVAEGRLREDLYYRLNVFPIAVPPLRERPGDILPLADFLIARAADKGRRGVPVFDTAAAERLLEYRWPGNVRELDNVVQRALILSQGEEITAEDLLFEPATIHAVAAIDGEEDPADSLGDDLKDHERRLILVALEEGHGSRKYAAEKLGISPRTLRYKVAQMRDQGIAIPGR